MRNRIVNLCTAVVVLGLVGVFATGAYSQRSRIILCGMSAVLQPTHMCPQTHGPP
ncbi:hypothetical protein K8R03_00190 [Candidatus Kaiserbacteria bacterium]|nr:hypothetical protein [Candidatus Kaiserbacteria bacterium]